MDRSSRLRFARVLLCSVIPALLLSTYLCAQPSYTVTIVGPANVQSSRATGVNDSGIVAGDWMEAETFISHAFIASKSSFTTLPTLGGADAGAMGINNTGVVVGWSRDGVNHKHAVKWQGGLPVSLGTLGGSDGAAAGINDSGWIVGQSKLATPQYHAFLYRNGAMEDLGFEGLARDVNQAGQAILSGGGSAFLWQAGGTTPLALTQADAINNLGRVAGVSGGEVAVWENGVTTGLGVPNALYAGINDSGDVVAGHFLWHGDSLYDINTLIEPGGDWTIVYSYGINNRGDIVGQATDGSKYRAVLLTPGPVVVTRPAGGQTVRTGEADTIRWTGTQKNGWEIFFSTDDGGTYSRIDTLLQPDVRELAWTFPDSLRSSDRSLIRVVDAVDTSFFGTSDRFGLRSLDLVRLDGGGAFTPFHAVHNTWSYRNDADPVWPPAHWLPRYDYQAGTDPFTAAPYPQAISVFRTAPGGVFPSWPAFVGAFGEPACYFGFPANIFLTYDGDAVRYWQAHAMPFDGACHGLAISALAVFLRDDLVRARFPQLPPTTFISGLPADSLVREVIAQYFTSQYGKAALDHDNNERNTTPKEVYYQLKAKFLAADPLDVSVLVIRYPGPGGGTHTMLPYQVCSHPSNPDKVLIKVYDSNNPLSDSTVVEVDTVGNTWQEFDFGWPALSKGMFLDLPLGELLAVPVMPAAGAAFEPRAVASGTSPDDGPHFSVANTSAASIVIKNASGDSIGYAADSVVGNLNDAIPIVPRIGRPHPPTGYYLPEGTYRVRLGGFLTGESRFWTFGPGGTYGMDRTDADPDESDLLAIGDGIGYASGDDSEKSITMSGLVRLDSSAFEFAMTITPAPADSIHLRTHPDGSLGVYVSPGPGMASDFGVTRISRGSMRSFSVSAIHLRGGAFILIEAFDEAMTSVRMLVDSAADGTVEDTLILTNELTGIIDDPVTGRPSKFILFQNYPNPFNPSTEIRYFLRERTDVYLAIYDQLGREVVTLVNGPQEAGERIVAWKADGMPGGVYYCRLRAAGETSTIKVAYVR